MEKLDPEIDVGIRTFLNQGQTIKGIFKYKISDFIVNEIDIDKNVLFLDRSQGGQIKEKMQEKKKLVQKKFNADDEDMLKQLFPDAFETILKFYSDLENGERQAEFIVSLECPKEKSDRIKIHEFVREKMPFFDSQTSKDSSKINIVYTKNCAKKQKTSNNIIRAVMMKKGIDTLSAVQKISQLLRIGSNFISTAGIKDKRGVTTQHVTFKGHFELDSLNYRLSQAMFSDNIQLSDFEFKDRVLRVGDLYGNRFSVLIRLFDHDKEKIIENFENIKKWGFINYFGTQRFGNTNLGRSHFIGLSILKKEFQETFNMILTVDPNHDQDLFDKIQEYKQNKDATTLLKILPNRYRIERQLIEKAQKLNHQNFYNVIVCIPRQRRNLYLHAYQSYIWNQLATIRIDKYGKQVQIGDIVSKHRQKIEYFQKTSEDDLFNDQDDNCQDQQIDFQYVNKDNISDFSINDVLIPLLGCNSQISEDFLLYSDLKSIIESTGITLDAFKNVGKEFLFEGNFRYLIQLVEDFQMKFLNFNDKKQDVLTPFYLQEEDINELEGKYTGLVMRFSLTKGSYATMLMREMTKISSSFENQNLLNQDYENF